MTKNTKTYLGAALALALALVPAVPMQVIAANKEDAVINEVDKTANARYVPGGANQADAANFYYVGSATEAVVTISATAMTFYAPAGTLDTSVGSSGVITFASTLGENTMGALCDYLNGITSTVTDYRCKLLDAKRDDAPGAVLRTQTATSGTNNLKAAGGFSADLTTTTIISLGINPAAGKRVVLRHCQVSNQDSGALSNTGNNLYVYGRLRKHGSGRNLVDIGQPAGASIVGAVADDTTEVWKSSTTQNTAIHQPPLTGYVDSWLEFAQDQHVVVRVGNLSGNVTTQTDANYVKCEWWEK